MNILYIVPYAPNLIRVRPYNLIRKLAERNHSVTLVTLWTSEQERKDLEEVKRVCKEVYSFRLSRSRALLNCLSAIPSRIPFQAAYCRHPAMSQCLSTLVNQSDGPGRFDVIHVEHLRGVQYGVELLRSKRKWGDRAGCFPPIIWDSVDCITQLFKQVSQQKNGPTFQLQALLDLKRTASYEGWLLNQFNRVLVTSENDKRSLLSLCDGKQHREVSVLSNGVDLDYFMPDHQTVKEPATLVVTGKMSYHANVAMVLHLVNDILPYVWQRRPDVKLWIVGKDPPHEVCGLANNRAVTVVGTVPDIRTYINRATIAAAPIVYGVGIQNKVLEAMACGTPVISTPQAVSALCIQPGVDALVACDAQDFAQKILDLLADPDKQRQLSRAGRKYVENHHDWGKITARLEDIYAATLEESRSILQAG